MDLMKKLYCRLCAKLTSHEKLLNFQTNKINLQMVLEKLNLINVHINLDDGMPKTVCIPCYSSLEQAVEFVEAVKKAQSILQDVLILKNYTEDEVINDSRLTNFDSFRNKNDFSDIELYSNDAITLKVEMESNPIENVSNQSENPITDEADVFNRDAITNRLDYNWMCSCCETLFPSVKELQKHSMEFHSKCNAYKCTDCGKRRHDLNGFVKHIATHKKYLKSAYHKYSLPFPAGQKLYAENLTSKFICIGCNTSFTTNEDLEAHKTQFYAFVRSNKSQRPESGSCNICHKNFKNLTAHMLTHELRTRNHMCETCGKSYFTKEALFQHYIAHKEDKPYECKICKQTFKTKTYLRCHVVVHNDVKLFSCDRCMKSFHRLKDLNHHKKIHTDTWYECNTCQKRYKLKKQLTLHLKLHSGVMPYSCEDCQWNFTNYTNYFKHMRGKHNRDIRKKRTNITDVTTLEWREKLIAKNPRQREQKEGFIKCQQEVT